MTIGSIAWFAHHEWRLSWRDWRLLMGRTSRVRAVILGCIGIGLMVLLHVLAGALLHPDFTTASVPTQRTLVTVTGTFLLSWSLMLSQSMEAVTRAFYTRGDLELILSSPIAAWRLFAVRICAMTVSIMVMALVLVAPFINVLAWRGGAAWLAAYPATMALAMIAVSLAILLTVGLFKVIGPKRTRIVAQIVAALIGAIFVISLQFAAILSQGSLDRLAFLESDTAAALAPAADSPLWAVAYAMMGYTGPLVGLMLASALGLIATIAVFAPRFGHIVLSAASIGAGHGQPADTTARPMRAFHNLSQAQSLRRKEWILIRRDPWLVSQTLVQILYLLPAAYLLWSRFDTGLNAATLLVPVLITAAGQFAGGLAWVAISSEDAPELIRTAPVTPRLVLRAKVEAVMSSTVIAFSPFILALFWLSFGAWLIALTGIAISGAAATAIQYWYRLQAHRGRIRRRQTASRLTTYGEAMSSIGWATTAAFAAADLWVIALIPGVFSGLVVVLAWFLSPGRGAARV